MGLGQGVQPAFAHRRQGDPHHAVVPAVGEAADEPGLHGAIDQLDGAVVAEQEVGRDVADARCRSVASDRQEELVLGRREPDLMSLVLAPVKEPAQAVAELQESLEVTVRK